MAQEEVKLTDRSTFLIMSKRVPPFKKAAKELGIQVLYAHPFEKIPGFYLIKIDRPDLGILLEVGAIMQINDHFDELTAPLNEAEYILSRKIEEFKKNNPDVG